MNPSTPARLIACLLPFALVACATQATSSSEHETIAPVDAVADPGEVASAADDGPLPPVPQPPERPVAPESVTNPDIPLQQRIDAFVEYTATTYGVDRAHIRRTLAQAQHRQGIIDAMNRPAEAVRQWHEYRPIFINQARIDGGIAFYSQHRAALDRIAAETGVPGEMIVAIIGVETSYGRVTGNYRVIDALYTLAFGFPRRAPFFAGELAQLFALEQAEPQLDILALQGSYAGAMGMGQFMPSSYRLWAKDGDGDGRRDLLTHLPDVFASIANYFVVHGWERGSPVVARASLEPGREEFRPETLDPVHLLSQLAARGYRPLPGEPVAEGATVLNFQGAAGPEYWIAYRNFYVISRYNRSPMYSLAVHQLAQAIGQGGAVR
jgi:membrane-bound lytic murein transglycosylase B